MSAYHEIEKLCRENKILLKQLRPVQVYKKADIYDLVYQGFPGDKEFYATKAAKGAVLYLGIGTGRIFSAIAKANRRAKGLDSSIAMIERLKQKNKGISNDQVVLGNALDAEFAEQSFETIIAPYCFLNFYSYKEIGIILNNVRRWLVSGGHFFTDFFSPFKNPPFETNVEFFERSIGPAKVYTKITYNHVKQEIEEHSLVERNGTVSAVSLKQCYYYPNELLRLFARAGFQKTNIFGGYQLKALTTEAEPMVIHAQKIL